MSSSLNDLKTVLTEALDNKGVLNELKSKLRAEIFGILEDNSFDKPKISQENLLINELIREYLEFNHYKYSKSVFMKESNQANVPLSREIIAAELHIKEDNTTKQVPLIYSILWNFLNMQKEEEEEEVEENKASRSKKNSIKTDNQRKNINIYKYNPEQFE